MGEGWTWQGLLPTFPGAPRNPAGAGSFFGRAGGPASRAGSARPAWNSASMVALPEVAVALLAALLLLASLREARRRQGRRLACLEERFRPPEAAPPYRPVPFSALAPPREPLQPSVAGCALPGGLLAWRGPGEVADVLLRVLLAREAPCAYLGPSPDEVVRRVAREALALQVDPRSRLLLPDSVEDLERLLEGRRLAPPWIVAGEEQDPADLARLHHRFGCPVVRVGGGEVPAGFLPFPGPGAKRDGGAPPHLL